MTKLTFNPLTLTHTLTGAVDKPFTFNAPCSYDHENCIIGAVNIENNEVNKFKTQITEYSEVPSPQAAAGIKWVVIGCHNYDEGSSRERAALELRFLGGLATISRSFARIHRTNSKKQDILTLTFADRQGPANDKVDVFGLDSFASSKNLTSSPSMRTV
ncbi:hypothetical protein H1R20_g9375, partial [Candolleomyces eurysporus]